MTMSAMLYPVSLLKRLYWPLELLIHSKCQYNSSCLIIRGQVFVSFCLYNEIAVTVWSHG